MLNYDGKMRRDVPTRLMGISGCDVQLLTQPTIADGTFYIEAWSTAIAFMSWKCRIHLALYLSGYIRAPVV